MRTANPAKFILLTGVCFVLAFVFVGMISAQKKSGKNAPQDRDLVKPTQTETNQTKTTVTKSNAKIETVKADTTPRKKILVVLDFDNVSVNNECRNDIYGKNVATQLSTAFSKTGNYTVIEKQRIEDVFKSIDASQDERYDSRTAAKVGKALSANSVVLGTITECNTNSDEKKILKLKIITHSVKVGLAIRLVDINTGEILEAVKVNESAEDRSGKIKDTGSETLRTSELITRLFNKAVEKAVNKSVGQLTSIIEGRVAPETAREKIPADGESVRKTQTNPPSSKPKTTAFPIVATVANDGITVYIIGLGQDVKIGDLFSIIRGYEIKNPNTGEVIDYDGSEIAKVEVTEVRETNVKAKIIKGKGIKEKDVVKPIQ